MRVLAKSLTLEPVQGEAVTKTKLRPVTIPKLVKKASGSNKTLGPSQTGPPEFGENYETQEHRSCLEDHLKMSR
jgi:hypothetical protein